MARQHFINANLLDGDRPMRRGVSVTVEGERIVAVDSRSAPGSDDRVVDLNGLTLMPGMVAGHFHAAYHDIGLARGFPAIERPPIYTGMRALKSLQTALSCGFTGVVSAGGPYDLDAQINDAIEDGIVVGPRIVPCSRDFYSPADSNPFASWWLPIQPDQGLIRTCSGPEEFRRAVREEINRGAKMIKVFATGGHGTFAPKAVDIVTPAELEAIVDAAHDRGVRVRTHITTKDRIIHAAKCGVDVLDHCDEMDEECIEAIAKAGAFVLPSLMYPALMKEAFLADPNTPVPFGDEEVAALAHMERVLPQVVAGGVRCCIGDDYGSPVMPHGSYGKELAVYSEHIGIDPLEVIRWATRYGGQMMGRDDLGMIASGMLADMIVVEGDPVQDLRVLGDPANIKAVIKGGALVHGELPQSERRERRAA